MSNEQFSYFDQGYTPPLPSSEETPKKKKSQLLSPLKKEEWDQMSGKAKWDSQVALRGPDLANSGAVKYFTSSVIRYRLSQVMRVGGMVNDRIPFVILPDGHLSLGKDQLIDLNHFLNHVQEAAAWLNVPVCWVSPATWKEVIFDNRGNHIHVAMNLISKVEACYRPPLEQLVSTHGYAIPKKKEAE